MATDTAALNCQGSGLDTVRKPVFQQVSISFLLKVNIAYFTPKWASAQNQCFVLSFDCIITATKINDVCRASAAVQSAGQGATQGLLAGQRRRRLVSHSQGAESASEWEEDERQMLPGSHLQGSQKLQSRWVR